MFSEFSTRSLRRNRTAINKLIYNYNNNHGRFRCSFCEEFNISSGCKSCIWSAVNELIAAIPIGNIESKKSYFQRTSCFGFCYNNIPVAFLKKRSSKDHELGIKLRVEDLYKWKKLIQEELRRRQGNLK